MSKDEPEIIALSDVPSSGRKGNRGRLYNATVTLLDGIPPGKALRMKYDYEEYHRIYNLIKITPRDRYAKFELHKDGNVMYVVNSSIASK